MLDVKKNMVTLVPHDDDWNKQDRTKAEIETILGDNIVEICHLGSIAIKGIVAKPILDVAIAIKNLEHLNIKKLCDGFGITLGDFFKTPEFDKLEQEIK